VGVREGGRERCVMVFGWVVSYLVNAVGARVGPDSIALWWGRYEGRMSQRHVTLS